MRRREDRPQGARVWSGRSADAVGRRHGIARRETAAAIAEQIGYPVIIKAVHGGGGKGIAVVHQAEEFPPTFQRISAEARSAFGNGDVYLERFISSLRHVEAQILRDAQGHTKVLG